MLVGGPRVRRPRLGDSARARGPAVPERRPLVAVLLGDGPHSFDRLLRWVSALTRDRVVEVVAQHGSTTLPACLSGAPHLDERELDELLDRATAVVTHGGATEILASRTRGHRPVAVPRLPELGEHGDGHQRDRVARLAERGLCAAASSRESLAFEVGSVLAARGFVAPPWGDDGAIGRPSPGGAPWPR